MDDRYYIYVRLWTGFPAGFPSWLFDDIADDDLQKVAAYIAAKWWQTNSADPAHPKADEWIQVALADPPSHVPELSMEHGFLVTTAVDPDFGKLAHGQVPTWSLLHAEDGKHRADEVISALPRCAPFLPAIRLRAVSRASLLPGTWLQLERELERRDRLIKLRSKTLDDPGYDMLDVLRIETQALSRLLGQDFIDPALAADCQSAPGAYSRPEDLEEGLGDAARSFVVSNAESARELVSEVKSLVLARTDNTGGSSLRLWGLGQLWPEGSQTLSREIARLVGLADAVKERHSEAERRSRTAQGDPNAAEGEAVAVRLRVVALGEAIVKAVQQALAEKPAVPTVPERSGKKAGGRKKRQRKRRSPERPLTDRQVEVYGLMQQHRSMGVVARELGLDEKTVREHYQAACRKLGSVHLAQERRKTQDLPHGPRGEVLLEAEDEEPES